MAVLNVDRDWDESTQGKGVLSMWSNYSGLQQRI